MRWIRTRTRLTAAVLLGAVQTFVSFASFRVSKSTLLILLALVLKLLLPNLYISKGGLSIASFATFVVETFFLDFLAKCEMW